MKSFDSLPLIVEGKTKVFRAESDMIALQKEKNDMTAGNGKRHELVPGKGQVCAEVSARLFELVGAHGVPHTFIGRYGPGINRVQRASMQPCEVVVRFYADGSYLKRHPDVPKGAKLPGPLPIVEHYLKTKGRSFKGIALPDDDPLIVHADEHGIDVVHPALRDKSEEQTSSLVHIPASALAGTLDTGRLGEMAGSALSVGSVVQAAWKRQCCRLIDFKVEFGIDSSNAIRLADSLSPDEMRVETPDGRLVCKEPFRQGASVEQMVELYTEALILTRSM